MAFNLWMSHLLISVFFVAGFITYYEWHVKWAIKTARPTTVNEWLRRFSVIGVTVLLCLWLQYITGAKAVSVLLFLNLQLIVITYPLLNDRLTDFEFWLQGAIGGTFWFINHLFDLKLFIGVALILVVMGTVLRLFRNQIRYSWTFHMIYAVVLSVSYWASYVGIDNWQRFGYIAMFMAMSIYSCIYSNATHKRALERAKLTHEVNFDALTGAKSYTNFLSESVVIFNQIRDDQQPLTFAELDIDNFKGINDRYSHLAGNGALVAVTNLLKTTLADYDQPWQLYRTGGEEFVMLFPNGNAQKTVSIVRACWQALRQMNYHYHDQFIKITASFGVTAVQPEDVVLADSYGRADDSLYISKQHGRDCITVDGETLDANPLSTVVVTHTYFTQPVIQIADQQPICQELLMRTFEHGRWVVPRSFDLGVTTQVSMMRQLLAQLSVKVIAINVTRAQFVDPHHVNQLQRFVATTPELRRLTLELSEAPTVAELKQVYAQYHDAGILIMLDSDLILQQRELLAESLAYIDGVKVDVHQLSTVDQKSIQQWQQYLEAHHKRLILKNIEMLADFELAQTLNVRYGQGYFFGRPVMPRMI